MRGFFRPASTQFLKLVLCDMCWNIVFHKFVIISRSDRADVRSGVCFPDQFCGSALCYRTDSTASACQCLYCGNFSLTFVHLEEVTTLHLWLIYVSYMLMAHEMQFRQYQIVEYLLCLSTEFSQALNTNRGKCTHSDSNESFHSFSRHQPSTDSAGCWVF